MQTTDLGADECLDPALMSAFEDGAVDPFDQWHCADANAGPPSPFDMSTIDPDLLALYPEQNGGVDCNAAGPPLIPVDSEAPERSLSPLPLREEEIVIQGSPTADTTMAMPESVSHGDSQRAKRVRFASISPRHPPSPAPEVSPRAERRATRSQAQKRAQNSPVRRAKKHTALGTAKRTISDGTLVPPSGPCARCVWEDEECLIKYPGAACNTCRRRGRKCELVDESVKYNGQRAKDLMRADGSGCVPGVV